ncbi:hypothetical protein F511_36493 [Dorcoceras hygrometricum]|uniref:Uncharacterized protein n=1 Tax=Dorcoceras hygrometricum TaxID=472368 RepID=A0A2Z7B1T3_9LAMI|nr:hypothetical protein F511_36493 [Dorcoceras hygrometricum]
MPRVQSRGATSAHASAVDRATVAREAAHRTAVMRDKRAAAREAAHTTRPPCATSVHGSNRIDQIREPGSDTTVGVRITPPDEATEEQKTCAGRRSIRLTKHETMTFIGRLESLPCWQLVPGSDRFRKENGTSRCIDRSRAPKFLILPLHPGRGSGSAAEPTIPSQRVTDSDNMLHAQ